VFDHYQLSADLSYVILFCLMSTAAVHLSASLLLLLLLLLL
jgi:hypothetical protein